MALAQAQKAYCVACGKEFDKYRKDNVYCSKECRRKGCYWKSRSEETAEKELKRKNDIRNQCGSLCWSCARAYARPDPEGCGKFRNKEKVWQEAIEKQVTYGGGVEITKQIVACEQYVKSQEREG